MKKTRKAGTATPKTQASSGALSTHAQHDLAAGRWREAIIAYKNLVRVADTPAAREGLAAAYAGRARELMAKGMAREALTIWENRAQIAPERPPEPDYLTLLLRLGRFAQAREQSVRWADRLEPATLASLRSHLAAHYLAGATEVVAGLPADDPILTQAEAANRSIDDYCRGDDVALGTSLAAIPFRSPYRDLALCLKALQRLPTAPAEATGMLARIDDDSGFAPLRRACELALGPAETLTERATAGEVTRRFALTLAGWGEARQALWAEAHQNPDTGPRGLLRLLNRHRRELGEDWARHQALRLLLPGFPKSAGLITEGGGPRLSEQERLLLSAWQSEDRRDPFATLDAWDRYCEHLIGIEPPPPGTDAALRIALCLRRVDTLFDVLGQMHPVGDSDDLDVEVADRVEQSLHYDPDDRDCHERLIRYHLKGDHLKEVRSLLDQGLKRFPADVGLLTAAMDAALAGDAFKKAARYAREILALDPINTSARERLVKAHLAHARKQVRARRPDLARKELDQAAEWDQLGALRERRALLAGLLMLSVDKGRGVAALTEQVETMGGGLSAALALLVEAVACGRPPATILKQAGLGKLKARDHADLTGFLTRLRGHLEGGETLAAELQRLFDKPLADAAGWPLTQAEYELACDTLRRAGTNQARLAFAEAALKRWPRTPVFVLHQFESRFEDQRRYPTPADLDRLEAAAEQARTAGDERTSLRILEALRPYALPPFMSGAPGGFWDDEDDEEDDEFGFPPLGGPLGVDPIVAMKAIIEIMGVDKFLGMVGLSAKERAEFKKIEREHGRSAVIEALLELMRETMPDFAREGLPGPGPRGPRRPGGGSKASRRKPPKSTDPDRGPGDDPGQLDLF